METSKNRRWTSNDVAELIGGVTMDDICRVIAEEFNKHIDTENKLTETIEGFVNCGKPIVVDEYMLEEVLTPENCQVCPCSNYCHKHHVWQYKECITVKKMFLKGKLKAGKRDAEADK